jgi:hypothetical protein
MTQQKLPGATRTRKARVQKGRWICRVSNDVLVNGGINFICSDMSLRESSFVRVSKSETKIIYLD